MARSCRLAWGIALAAIMGMALRGRPAFAETGPAVRILAPADNARIEADSVTVEVLASPRSPATGVASVSVQGKAAKPHREHAGVWTLTVALGAPGRYEIAVVATDDRGGSTRAKVQVLRVAESPAAATRLPETIQWLCVYEGARPTASDEEIALWLTTAWAPSGDAQRALDEICRQAAVVSPPQIFPGPVPNAAAAIRGTERIIVFNNDFVKQLRAGTRSDWAFVSVLAHELGHHINGHTPQAGGSNPAIELQADESSGMIMARLGATLSDALLAIDRLGSPVGTGTHPAKADRLRAIEKGYRTFKPTDEPAPPPAEEAPVIRIPPPAMKGDGPPVPTRPSRERLVLTSAMIRHDVEEPGPVVPIQGMNVTPVGEIAGFAGRHARIVIRFAYADGTPLRAMAGDTRHDDGRGNLILPLDFKVAVERLDLASGSFFLPYAALNFAPTGYAVVHQLSLQIELTIVETGQTVTSPRVGFAFRW